MMRCWWVDGHNVGAAMQLELVAKAPDVETLPLIAAEEKHIYFKIGLTFLFFPYLSDPISAI